MKIMIKSSNPTCPSCARNHDRSLLDQDESRSRLWPSSEMHPPRETCNHETVCLRTHETSHCKTCDSFLNILTQVHNPSHQTSTEKESYVRLLSQILGSILAQRGSLTPTGVQFLDAFCRLSALSLEYRVEQREDHIRILFHDGTHPESVHSELIRHLNSHSS